MSQSLSPGRIAVMVNVMYEQWSAGVAPGIGPMGNPLREGLDHQALSWAAYGPRTGVTNLLRVLNDTGVTATFYVNGILARTQPDSVEAIAAGGHAIEAHGWAQDLVPASLTPDVEARTIDDTVAALTTITGRAPSEWISPRCTPSAVTAELLAARGFGYFGDVFDADLPYRLPTAEGEIIAVPFGMEINDLPHTIRYGHAIEELVADYRASVDARRGSDQAMLDVTFHAHIGGRPNGIAALRAIIELARADHDVTLMTRVAAAQRTITS